MKSIISTFGEGSHTSGITGHTTSYLSTGTSVPSNSQYSLQRNLDSNSTALTQLAKNYEDRHRAASGPYLQQAVGTIFGSSVGSKSVGSMSDPDRLSLHSSRSSIVANQERNTFHTKMHERNVANQSINIF